MTLKWPARFFVDVDDFPIGIAWQVNIIVDIYLCHFLIDLCLYYSVSTVYIWKSFNAPFSLLWTS